MAVFYDTGGGDIYGGPTKEEVLEAMRMDGVFNDYGEDQIVEVDGSHKIRVMNEDEEDTGELITLAEEYGNGDCAYCVASNNC